MPKATTAAPKVATAALPAGVTLAMVTFGDSVFNNGSCVRCHGAKGVGATNGPTLANKVKWDHGSGSYVDILHTITTGIPKDQIKDPSHPFAMGAMGGRMPINADQAAAAAAYVWSLNHPVK
ncbi:MAG: c-type cytochrome [Gemmatimonadaceae bacterium]